MFEIKQDVSCVAITPWTWSTYHSNWYQETYNFCLVYLDPNSSISETEHEPLFKYVAIWFIFSKFSCCISLILSNFSLPDSLIPLPNPISHIEIAIRGRSVWSSHTAGSKQGYRFRWYWSKNTWELYNVSLIYQPLSHLFNKSLMNRKFIGLFWFVSLLTDLL